MLSTSRSLESFWSQSLKNVYLPKTWSKKLKPPDELHKKEYLKYLAWEVVFYAIFLSVLLCTAFDNRDQRGYGFHKSIVKALNPKKNVEKISTPDDMFAWASKHLAPFLYVKHHWNGSRLDEVLCKRWEERPCKQSKLIIASLASYRVGALRIRQHRVRPEPCEVYHHLDHLRCVPSWSSGETDWADYSPGWVKMAPNFTEKTSARRSPWLYSRWAQIGGTPVAGRLGFYPLGGYVLDMPGNQEQVMKNLTHLQNLHWVDNMTRVVFIETTIYTPNTNMFALITAIFEFPQAMVVQAEVYAHPFKLFTYMGSYPLSTKFFDFFMYITVIWLAVILGLRLQAQKRKFFRKFWNVLELLNLAVAMAVVVLYVGRQVISDHVFKGAAKAEGQFYNFQTLAMWDQLFGILLGCCCCLTTLKVLHLLRFNRRMSLLGATMRRAASELLAFFVMYSLIMTGFVHFCFLVLCPFLYRYSTVMGTIQSLLLLALGDMQYEEITSANRVFAPVLIVLYMALIAFLLLDVLISILMDAFAMAREAIKDQANDLELLDTTVDTVKSVFTTCRHFRRACELACRPQWTLPKKPEGGAGSGTAKTKTTVAQESAQDAAQVYTQQENQPVTSTPKRHKRDSQDARYIGRSMAREFSPRIILEESYCPRQIRQGFEENYTPKLDAKITSVHIIDASPKSYQQRTPSTRYTFSPTPTTSRVRHLKSILKTQASPKLNQDPSFAFEPIYESTPNPKQYTKSALYNPMRLFSPRPMKEPTLEVARETNYSYRALENRRSISMPNLAPRSLEDFMSGPVQMLRPTTMKEFTLEPIPEENMDNLHHRIDLVDQRIDRLWLALVGTELGQPPELDTICRYREVTVAVADVVAEHLGSLGDSDVWNDSDDAENYGDFAGHIVTLNDSNGNEDTAGHQLTLADKDTKDRMNDTLMNKIHVRNRDISSVGGVADKKKNTTGSQRMHTGNAGHAFTVAENEMPDDDNYDSKYCTKLVENVHDANVSDLTFYELTSVLAKRSLSLKDNETPAPSLQEKGGKTVTDSLVLSAEIRMATDGDGDEQNNTMEEYLEWMDSIESIDFSDEEEMSIFHLASLGDTDMSVKRQGNLDYSDMEEKVPEKNISKRDTAKQVVTLNELEIFKNKENVLKKRHSSGNYVSFIEIKGPVKDGSDETYKHVLENVGQSVHDETAVTIHNNDKVISKMDSVGAPVRKNNISEKNKTYKTELPSRNIVELLNRNNNNNNDEDFLDRHSSDEAKSNFKFNAEDSKISISHPNFSVMDETRIRPTPFKPGGSLKNKELQDSKEVDPIPSPKPSFTNLTETPKANLTIRRSETALTPVEKLRMNFERGLRPATFLQSRPTTPGSLDSPIGSCSPDSSVSHGEKKPSVNSQDAYNDSGYLSTRDVESATPDKGAPYLKITPSLELERDVGKKEPMRFLSVVDLANRRPSRTRWLNAALLPRLEIVDELGAIPTPTHAGTPPRRHSDMPWGPASFPPRGAAFEPFTETVSGKPRKSDAFAMGALAVARRLSQHERTRALGSYSQTSKK